MQVGTYADGRPLIYEPDLNKFRVGRWFITPDQLRHMHANRQLTWWSEEWCVWAMRWADESPAVPAATGRAYTVIPLILVFLALCVPIVIAALGVAFVRSPLPGQSLDGASVRTGKALLAKLDAADRRWPLAYLSCDGYLEKKALSDEPILYGRAGGLSPATWIIRTYPGIGETYLVQRLPSGGERWQERLTWRSLPVVLLGNSADVIVFDGEGRPVSLTRAMYDGASESWSGTQTYTFDYEGPVRDGRRRDEPE